MGIRDWIGQFALGKKFSKQVCPEDELFVVYAGPDENGYDDDNRFEFGVFVPIDGQKGQWVPAAATDPDVIKTLQEMVPGQPFFVTDEENDGPLGTLVKAIEKPDGLKPYKLPTSKPRELVL